MDKKPKQINYGVIAIGTVLFEKFFVVGIVPPDGKGFYICGTGDSTSGREAMIPTLGTDEEVANRQYEMITQELARGGVGSGTVVLIELSGGTVKKMFKYEDTGQQAHQA